MWYLLYNSLLLLVSPIILFVLLAKQRCRRGLPQRLGLQAEPPAPEPDDRSGCIWIHAVSLGEVVAVAPLVRDLRRRYPEMRLVVSTVTETGREAVEQRLEGVAEHRYAPLDFPGSSIRPSTVSNRVSIFSSRRNSGRISCGACGGAMCRRLWSTGDCPPALSSGNVCRSSVISTGPC